MSDDCEHTTEQTENNLRCESHYEDGSQCENDAIGKYYVELTHKGDFYQGELWLCEEHEGPGEPLETPDEVEA